MSVLRKAAHEYLQVRRALGYKLEAQGHLLLQFVEYLEQRGALVITTELALEWARQPADASQLWWHQRLSVVRGFARYLVGLDPRTEVPANDLLPARSRRAVPCLYSEAEIARLMRAARALPTPLKAATFETLIGLLSVTGMRVSEAIWLDRDDVDLDGEWLLIRRAKNERSREVPLHQSTSRRSAPMPCCATSSARGRCRRASWPRAQAGGFIAARSGTCSMTCAAARGSCPARPPAVRGYMTCATRMSCARC